MWGWITWWRHSKAQCTRDTAETHLGLLRGTIAQVRADLADLQDELAFMVEDLDGLTRHVERTQRRLAPAAPAPARPILTPEEREALQPATFTATHRQRTEKETL